MYFGTGDFIKAKNYVETVLNIDSKDLTAIKNIILILYNMRKYDEAYKYYNVLLDLDPNFKDPELKVIFDDLKNRVN